MSWERKRLRIKYLSVEYFKWVERVIDFWEWAKKKKKKDGEKLKVLKRKKNSKQIGKEEKINW